jgi:hypothetical protein
LFEHDLFGKPLHTFPDHALAVPASLAVPGVDGAIGLRSIKPASYWFTDLFGSPDAILPGLPRQRA